MAHHLSTAKALVTRVTGYHFQDDALLMEAIDTTGMRTPQSNQRLAILGDAVLKHVLVDDWYPSGTPKGTANNIVSTIGSNANLAAVARRVELGSCVITNPGHCGPVSQGTLATTVEAILGAIYLDSDKDMDAVKSAMAALELTAADT